MSAGIKLGTEDLALLRRLAPKAGDALSKIHGMAKARTPEERSRNVYMSIPARPEHDADIILGDIVKRLPALLDLAEEALRLREVIAYVATGRTTYPGRGPKRCAWCQGKPPTRDGIIEHTEFCPTDVARRAQR